MHRNQLTDSARLIERRHQEQVAARIDLMRQILVIAAVVDGLPFIGRFHPLERIFRSLLASAQNDKLNIHTKDLRQLVRNQIDPLLVRQTRNQSDHAHIVGFLEPQHLLQRKLVGLLARHPRTKIIVLGKTRILLRIPGIGIDAVDNTDKIIAAVTQNAVHTLAEVRRQNLLCISRRNGRHLISIDDAGLHKRDAGIELDRTIVEIVVIQSQAAR